MSLTKQQAEKYLNSQGLEKEFGMIEISFDGMVKHLEVFALINLPVNEVAECICKDRSTFYRDKEGNYLCHDWYCECARR